MDIEEAIEVLKKYLAMCNSELPMAFSRRTLIEAIDMVVNDYAYLDQYTDDLQKTALPHTHKIEVLIRKQQRTPQDMSWFIAEASSIVIKAYNRGFGNGFDEGIKFKQQRKDANKDRKQG